MSTCSFRTSAAHDTRKNLITLLRHAHTPVPNAAAPLSVKGKVQRNPQSPYGITLPVLGSMRLPATKPVVGSVPIGRRKSRMCGSGLAAAGARAGSERAVGWLMRQGRGRMRRQALSARPGGAWHKGVVSRPVAGTCGWNSAPIRGFAARRCRATPYQSAGAPWAQSWQCAWARSRDCAASERVN